MSTIIKQSGVKYRVLKDAATKTWAEISYVNQAKDCILQDGTSVQSKIDSYDTIINNISVGAKATVVTNVLRSLTSEVSLSHNDINDDSAIIITTSQYGLAPKNAVQSGHIVTLSFDPQPTDVGVKLIVFN